MHKKLLNRIGKQIDYIKKAEIELKKNGIKLDGVSYFKAEQELHRLSERMWSINHSKKIIKHQKNIRIHNRSYKA